MVSWYVIHNDTARCELRIPRVSGSTEGEWKLRGSMAIQLSIPRSFETMSPDVIGSTLGADQMIRRGGGAYGFCPCTNFFFLLLTRNKPFFFSSGKGTSNFFPPYNQARSSWGGGGRSAVPPTHFSAKECLDPKCSFSFSWYLPAGCKEV